MFGGSSIERPLFDEICRLLPKGATVMELGSGDGTNELLKRYKVVSVEQNLKYIIRRGKEHTCLYSPLVDGWYRERDIEAALRYKPDLILIDGPIGKNRKRIVHHFGLFERIECPVIFDDVNREIDYKATMKFCKALNYSYHIHIGEQKHFAVCEKNK